TPSQFHSPPTSSGQVTLTEETGRMTAAFFSNFGPAHRPQTRPALAGLPLHSCSRVTTLGSRRFWTSGPLTGHYAEIVDVKSPLHSLTAIYEMSSRLYTVLLGVARVDFPAALVVLLSLIIGLLMVVV